MTTTPDAGQETTVTEDSPRAPRRRAVLIAVTAALVVVVVAVLVLVRHEHRSVTVPYADPAAAGALALCDARGHQVTSGRTTDQPFAYEAVGRTAARGAYAGTGRTATLLAVQPRAGVDAGSWSSYQLTAGTSYAAASRPVAVLGGGGLSLAQFLSAYPALDGFVQLRLYLSAPGAAAQASSYDTADIHVTGTNWQQIGAPSAAAVDCDAVAE